MPAVSANTLSKLVQTNMELQKRAFAEDGRHEKRVSLKPLCSSCLWLSTHAAGCQHTPFFEAVHLNICTVEL